MNQNKKETKNQIFQNAVYITEENLGIEKDESKCIDCGECQKTCDRLCHLDILHHPEKCLQCGQCIFTCPVFALKPKDAISEIKGSLKKGKTLICFISPASRVSIGEAFGLEPGSFSLEKLIGALKEVGFKYVLDTTFGADLTIMEEASELVNRMKNQENLPMMSSCCPAWVKYLTENNPTLIPHLSTCKSPIAMQGEMINKYFCSKMHLKSEDIFTVAVTPCTAKKYEIKQEQGYQTNAVLTVSELADWLKKENISFTNITPTTFDSIFHEGSGGGTLFGITGGVTSSLLRTYYYFETGSNLEEIHFESLHGSDNIKTCTLKIKEQELKVAVVQGIKNVFGLLEEIKAGKSPYHMIEVMNCEGGCVGGGGQIRYPLDQEQKIKEQRKEGLKKRDETRKIRFAHQNPEIIKLYEELLGIPNSEIAKKYLHRTLENQKMKEKEIASL